MNHYRANVPAWLCVAIIGGVSWHADAWAQPATKNLPEMPPKIYDKVAPATVKIFYAQGSKNGTGVIIGITTQGRALILTACHVVAVNFTETDPDIALEFYQDVVIKTSADIKFMRASVLPNYVDRDNDLALLATNVPVSVDKAVSYNRTDKVNPGETVAAFGFPGTEELAQTVGRITRIESKYIVFDARIAPGNSGGPLVDKNGRMIGVSTFVVGAAEGYAVNMNLVLSVVENWLKGIRLDSRLELQNDSSFLTNPWFIATGLLASGTAGYLILQENKNKEEPDIASPPKLP